MTPAPVASPVPTVSFLSGRDRAELVGAPLLRLPLLTDVPSVTTIDLMPSAQLQNYSSVVLQRAIRTANWAWEQQAEPACNEPMRYRVLGRPEGVHADFLSCSPPHQHPSPSEIREVVGKGRLHTTDNGIILLDRQPSPPLTPGTQRPVGRTACLLNDEPNRIYVCCCSRPPGSCAGLAFHRFLSLGTARTLRNARTFLLVDRYEHLHPAVWLRNCLKYRARKTSRQTVRWPIITMPLPEGSRHYRQH